MTTRQFLVGEDVFELNMVPRSRSYTLKCELDGKTAYITLIVPERGAPSINVGGGFLETTKTIPEEKLRPFCAELLKHLDTLIPALP